MVSETCECVESCSGEQADGPGDAHQSMLWMCVSVCMCASVRLNVSVCARACVRTHARRGIVLCVSVRVGASALYVFVRAKEETQEVRRQTDRQMDRQGQDPAPLQGHSGKIFNPNWGWHPRMK